VVVHGWRDLSEVDAIELACRMAGLGVVRIVYTDISRDGMLSGVNARATAELAAAARVKVIASGGVRDLRDVQELKAFEHQGIEGVITGQAIYTGALDLAAAIELANKT
jgi:phosphoribosylformimino-5-aminoimidazole carboxamide ribotide isomerase